MNTTCILLCILFIIGGSVSYRILAVFPYNGRSHHIFYSSLVEELALRKHDVTVINYFPVRQMPNLLQITLQNKDNESDSVDMENHMQSVPYNIFADFFKAYDSAKAFEYIANSNCQKLMENKEVQDVVRTKFDVVITEQFVTDCGLALAHMVNAPSIGMTAHVLMPWSYPRLGAPNNPSFVPNHFFGTGTKPDLWNRAKSTLINIFFNIYYTYVIQRKDNEIVKNVFPNTPDLEALGRNISLIMLNQYFPLTGSRLHGANIVEIGGMHIKNKQDLLDEELYKFLENARNGVVFMSFGSVAKNFPQTTLNEIVKVMQKSSMKFIWKVDSVGQDVPNNTLLRRWFPQPAILCHPKVVAFVTHSGMLSSSEAMHCGVPVVCVPLFGDQFANAASAVENGLGVTVDLATLDENILSYALQTVLQHRYQYRAKHLSSLWRDRPRSPMDTAVYWIEYVARHNGNTKLKPPTVGLPLYQYFMLDVIAVLGFLFFAIMYIIIVLVNFFIEGCKSGKKEHRTKKD